MAKRPRSPSKHCRSNRLFRYAADDLIAISEHRLNLKRAAGGPFAVMMDGGGGFGPPGEAETIFQRFEITAPVVARLVMAAKGTLDVDHCRLEGVAAAAERLGGFTFIDRRRMEETERKQGGCPEEDEGRLYEWRSVHQGYAGQILAQTQEGFTFAGFQPDAQLYHFKKRRQLS